MDTPHEPTLSIRINNIDHTVVHSGPLDNTALPRAPIIRVYGKTSTGGNACLHIHQVYPYFFIEYLGATDAQSVNLYTAKLTHSLNHAIAVSLRRRPRAANSHFIRSVILVKGVHFYGFHSKYSPFLKILLVDPAYMRRAVTLLQSGAVMKSCFRTYESHVSFVLQFLCDFSLYGCGWLHLSSDIWQRDSGEEDTETSYPTSPYYKQTRMPLEFDVESHAILNRHRLAARDFHHKLSIPATPQPPEPLVLSVRELWEDERRRRIAKGLPPSPEIPQDLSEGARHKGGEWVAEARWWEEIQNRIEREREHQENGFEAQDEAEWESWVMTSFESVEALWAPHSRTWKPPAQKGRDENRLASNPYDVSTQAVQQSQKLEENEDVDVDVDDAILHSQELAHLVQREDDRDEEEHGKGGGGIADIGKEEGVEEEPSAQDLYGSPETSQSRVQPFPLTFDPKNPFFGLWTDLGGNVYYGLGGDLPEDQVPITDDNPQQIGDESPIQSADASPAPDPQRLPLNEGVTMSATARSFPVPIIDESPENPFFVPSRLPVVMNDESESGGDHAEVPLHPALHDERDEMLVEIDAEQSARLRPLDDTDTTIQRPRKRRKLETDIPSTTPSATAAWLQHHLARTTSTFPPLPNLSESSSNCYVYSRSPPSSVELMMSLEDHGLPSKIYRDPYYSLQSDAPEHPWEYAGLSYHLKGGTGISDLEDWVPISNSTDAHLTSFSQEIEPGGCPWGWEYASAPPTAKEVSLWWEEEGQRLYATEERSKPSQIEGPTQFNPYGLKTTPVDVTGASYRQTGNMEVLALEVFAPSQGIRVPDPDKDEVAAVFWCLHSPDHDGHEDSPSGCTAGVIVVRKPLFTKESLRSWKLEVLDTELDLLNRVVDFVHELDPDIIVGWEVQTSSWGYLNARYGTYGLDLGEQISRAPGRMHSSSDQWGERTASTFKVVGRHVLNIWRIIRVEHDFTSHTFEHAVFQLLRRRTPQYPLSALTAWYNSSVPEHGSRLLRYFSERVLLLVEVINTAELINKNAEFARVFGVDFFSVISRGSQFKVESFMFRIAKPESFLLLSPSKKDVGRQNAAECMPLIMEPLSGFYSSPLVVLDFQSLYPSVMIAYNYCYSTCLGRVADFKGQNKLGVTELHQTPGLLEKLKDYITVAPNGIIYVKPDVRKGLLGRMLTELLQTRVMVKQAMKSAKGDKALQRVLDARQLGLKYIANVTYGYTGATFSGRMPAVEIADSIVQSGRETLEKAIQLIETSEKWGAKVVYGDTDSLFIYLRGKTKEQAFRIGADIADTVTAMNPAPIKLKFEKVYLPCVLMAKKRYVGFKYETPDEKEPTLDAKGIETIRRDGIPAQRKMVEACLKLLFRTQDLSQIKDYCYTMWSRILQNKVSVQDFTFSKEIKMGTYSDKGPPPPGVIVAARRMARDPNDEPQHGERVPYVIARGKPLTRLVDRAVAPEELLQNGQMHIDASYYISRVLIPPLERIFNLMGADVRGWYDEMPKPSRMDEQDSIFFSPRKAHKITSSPHRLKIDEHFLSVQCFICRRPTVNGLCGNCRSHPQETMARLLAKVKKLDRRMQGAHATCASCSGIPLGEPIHCESLDCEWFYERKKLERKINIVDLVNNYLEEVDDHRSDGEVEAANQDELPLGETITFNPFRSSQ